MSSSFGPRIYLVGQILSALLVRCPEKDESELIDDAIRMADNVEERMMWPDGKP